MVVTGVMELDYELSHEEKARIAEHNARVKSRRAQWVDEYALILRDLPEDPKPEPKPKPAPKPKVAPKLKSAPRYRTASHLYTVYGLFDECDRLLYVGQTCHKDPRDRYNSDWGYREHPDQEWRLRVRSIKTIARVPHWRVNDTERYMIYLGGGALHNIRHYRDRTATRLVERIGSIAYVVPDFA